VDGACGGHHEATPVRVAASSNGQEHPLAAAIVRGAEERGLATAAVGDFRSMTGKGVTGVVDGRTVAVGDAALLADLGLGASADPLQRCRRSRGRRDGDVRRRDGAAAGLWRRGSREGEQPRGCASCATRVCES
jgi:Cu+-exporting ATPase